MPLPWASWPMQLSGNPMSWARRMALAGGDDYELCFTAPARFHGDIMRLAQLIGLPLSCIGQLADGSGIEVLGLDGQLLDIDWSGFDHFA